MAAAIFRWVSNVKASAARFPAPKTSLSPPPARAIHTSSAYGEKSNSEPLKKYKLAGNVIFLFGAAAMFLISYRKSRKIKAEILQEIEDLDRRMDKVEEALKQKQG